MYDLPEKTKEILREFQNSIFYPAYKEYVLTEAGKCLGQIRTSKEDDAYVKGQMHGIEKLLLDLNADMVQSGNVEKGNKENREYTGDLLNKDMENFSQKD